MSAQTILIAEDEPHIVESLRFLLEREGYRVSAAGDGEAALRLAAATRPSLLILDVMLPRMNGFEVLRRLRADAALRGTPVLMLTAKGQSHDRRTAQEIGADAFITKPFSNSDVVAQVRRLARA
ncbi:response regulator transcription factor [Oceanicella actignis]|uniref:Response regulator receiver domain-containing protein n=1 Tax=Oceanicella actignis TaxID=1189325 RepID=A0A1M7TAV5_9RHOB|nr:response regulator [Oceanicella actignis]TYO89189.1 response regulator receiver domain-containing protein [Oceanicella actignis]SET52825.1 Response regulator receiver domain-containing protein [Oceanicella actignis]SHN67823.1 Response regulator receiver domain-containing protein [Oceanicella actignis]